MTFKVYLIENVQLIKLFPMLNQQGNKRRKNRAKFENKFASVTFTSSLSFKIRCRRDGV